MRKEVVEYECDNCETPGVPEEGLDQSNPIPLGWVYLSVRSNHGMLADLHLCASCNDAIKDALRERGITEK